MTPLNWTSERPTKEGRIKRLARWILRNELDARDKEFGAEIHRLANKDLMIEELGLNGSALHVSLSHPWAITAIAESLFDTLEKTAGENYVECVFQHRKSGEQILVTVHRQNGKTPHQLRQLAEAELAKLRRQIKPTEAAQPHYIDPGVKLDGNERLR